VHRCRYGATLVALLVGITCLLLASPSEARSLSLQQRLDRALASLQHLRADLQATCLALRNVEGVPTASAQAGLSAQPAQMAVLKRHLNKLHRQIRVVRRRIRSLRWLIAHPMQPASNGSWAPVINAAARHYHVSAAGLRRLMSLESGGRADAVGGGLFFGLFQYCTSTWKAAWNPFRRFGILHGGAQIWATAAAIHRGWGRHMWPHTYPLAFGAAAR